MLLFFQASSLPPAAKSLVIITIVYAVVQSLKQAPWFSTYVKGWWAVAVNSVFAATGILVLIPENQLYTLNTLLLLINTVLGAAGIHGTVSTLRTPTVPATLPPDATVVNLPAHLVPDDPAAKPVEPKP